MTIQYMTQDFWFLNNDFNEVGATEFKKKVFFEGPEIILKCWNDQYIRILQSRENSCIIFLFSVMQFISQVLKSEAK